MEDGKWTDGDEACETDGEGDSISGNAWAVLARIVLIRNPALLGVLPPGRGEGGASEFAFGFKLEFEFEGGASETEGG